MRPGAIDLSPVPGLPRGEFEDGSGREAAGDPTRRDLGAQVDHPPPVVEEEDLDREAHPERMDPSASRDQQALTGKIAMQGVGPFIIDKPSFRWAPATLPYSGPGKNISGRQWVGCRSSCSAS